MLAFTVRGEWSEPNTPRLSISPPDFPLYILRGANRMQRHCNGSVVSNEFSIVTCEVQVASDVLTVFRLRAIHYHRGLMFLGVDAVLFNAKAAKDDFLISPGVFYTFSLETMFH